MEITTRLTVWAIPNRYRLPDEGEFEFKIFKDDSEPYNEGAFKVREEYLNIEFDLPTDTITPQVAALAAEIENERGHSAMRVRALQSAIDNLLALPAPTEEKEV